MAGQDQSLIQQPKGALTTGNHADVMRNYRAKPLATLQELLERFQQQIDAALPKHMTPERMIRVVLTTVSQVPKLMECDPFTICGAVVQASILGLEPNSLLGEAFLVPYWNNKRTNPITNKEGVLECQLQVGYKGHVKLARNSGELSMVDAQIIHQNDDFQFDKGMNPYLLHKWDHRPGFERGPKIGAWGGFKLKDGTFNFEVWTEAEIIAHRDRFTKSKNREGVVYGPWIDNPDWMWKKTPLIQALKLAPKSVEQSTALALDEVSEANQPQRFIDVPAQLQPPISDEDAVAQLEAAQQTNAETPKRKSDRQQQQQQSSKESSDQPSLV